MSDDPYRGWDAADVERATADHAGTRDYSRRRLDPGRCPFPCPSDERLLCRAPVIAGTCVRCKRPKLEVNR